MNESYQQGKTLSVEEVALEEQEVERHWQQTARNLQLRAKVKFWFVILGCCVLNCAVAWAFGEAASLSGLSTAATLSAGLDGIPFGERFFGGVLVATLFLVAGFRVRTYSLDPLPYTAVSFGTVMVLGAIMIGAEHSLQPLNGQYYGGALMLEQFLRPMALLYLLVATLVMLVTTAEVPPTMEKLRKSGEVHADIDSGGARTAGR